MTIEGINVAAIMVDNIDMVKRMMQQAANIRAIGNAAYNRFITAAQNGAGVDEILMKLPIDIIHEPREFAEAICRDAEYLKSMPEYDESLGKPQNKLGEAQPNGYAKTVGKPQNKLDESLFPDNTDLIDDLVKAIRMSPAEKETPPTGNNLRKRTFLIMQDIHDKDEVHPCYDKTIIAALHTPHGIFLGTNGIKKQPAQHICPRKGQSINQGYDKCVEQCQQPSHAELAALLKYKARVYEPDFENSWMEVYGAKEVCYHCKTTLELVGIQRIILKPLKQLGEIHDYQ